MFRQSRFIFLTVMLLMVLFVSMARPMAVYADDSTPPPPTEEPANPPAEEAATETPSESSSTESATESEPAVVSEILEAAPEGTEVVVLDENSEVVPLASQEAAEIVAVTDPMWCPAGVLPGGAGCTTSFLTPQELIDTMDDANPSTTNSVFEQDGIIYFTVDPGGQFVLRSGGGSSIESPDYEALKIYNLTLQGGWNGLNDGAGFTLSGQTDFGANRVQIGSDTNPWVGNVTIRNFTIDGVTNNSSLVVITAGDVNLDSVVLQNNTVQSGLRVVSGADITLNNVISQNNATRGANLDNTTGTGNINISESSFSDNGDRGLTVLSNGNITLAGVLAQGNADSGAELNNTTGTGNINISSSNFSDNGQDGFEVFSNGDITVIICSDFVGNSKYGIDGSVLGLLTLNDVFFSENGSGNYSDSVSPSVSTGGCIPDEGSEEEPGGEEGPGGGEGQGGGEGEEQGGGEGQEVVEAVGDEEQSSSSNSAGIIPLTGLSLHIVSVTGAENVDLDCAEFSGTKLVLPNGDSVILPCPIRDEGSLAAQDALPGQLDDQFELLSALNTEVIRDGQTVSTVDPSLIVEFVIPDGQNTANLAILHWDGSKWVEFPGQVTSDGYFAVTTNFTGVFVLVTK